MKNLLKNLKKSEISIYVIAIMLVAAGYLNYTNINKDNLIQTSTIIKEATNTETENTSIGDATLVNSDDVINEDVEENNINTKSNTEENELANVEINETIETNANQSDYFIDSKLNRDTTYASMISNYTAILEKEKVSETEKKIAMQEITNINNIKNSIMICENILSTKGFDNNVVFINKKSINVVVHTSEGLTQDKVAQIQNIISRELEAEIQNIHITEK